MATRYSLNGEISSFFESNTTVTRQQCDNFALSRATGQVNPAQIQGVWSYTLIAGNSKVFQFRAQSSRLDMDIMSLAKAIHPQFVAGCKYHGTIGQSRPLHIYEIDNLPGATYVMARDSSDIQPPDAIFRQRSTVKDYASFFAQSWNSSQQPEDAAALLAEFHSKFDLLSQSLPSRFASNLGRVRPDLPALFSGALPFALSHWDLCEMNVLINPETGNITWIVDWAEARILPFGFSLWGLENVLGYMDSKGWHYYDNRRELEDLFWQTFLREARNVSDTDLRLIRVARMAGLFCRYGFIAHGKTVRGVVDQTDAPSLRYLDAFCTTDDWATTTPEDIHEKSFLSDLSAIEYLMSSHIGLGMAFVALELSHAWLESKSCQEVRRAFFHVSRVQHDGAVILDDELAHLRNVFGKDLKP
ncbi:hypothetical protein TOPH_08589 [Tolypocladium ophioglossoides CBS 100239]|uniref:Aminoglycoside phosphotransferase domain-containing protein n=1 Tax=Tolypocladium ophioglossoides (strain CBS 100239) TaxID=1163406 RepID=A0A0L0MYB1_TOLOC|nr:hypothetical protein TOPH_08589 [Tolypocladium ophioglossoides CBS 100239]